VELQSQGTPKLSQGEWETVLERVLEAYSLNDPVITNFEWPLMKHCTPDNGSHQP
jgi:hypothetical protein